MSNDERDFEEEEYNRHLLETGDFGVDLWWDDASYIRYQMDWGDDELVYPPMLDYGIKAPAVDYDDPPF